MMNVKQLKVIGQGSSHIDYDNSIQILAPHLSSALLEIGVEKASTEFIESASNIAHFEQILNKRPQIDDLSNLLVLGIVHRLCAKAYENANQMELSHRFIEKSISFVVDGMTILLNKSTPYDIISNTEKLNQIAAFLSGLKIACSDNILEIKEHESAQRHSIWQQFANELSALLKEPNADEAGIGGWETISLNTIDDYTWLTEMKRIDPTDFDVHSVKHISVAEILSRIGHTQPTSVRINADKLEHLKCWAMTEKQTEFAQSLQQAFELPTIPQFSGRINSSLNNAITLDVEGATLKFVPIPPGSFWMGSSHLPHAAPDADIRDDERPRHRVEIGKPLLISATPVTQAFWQTIFKSNPSKHLGETHPVETVSWLDAIEFCNRLSILEGLKPAYTMSKTGSVEANFESNGYRLPTEAEWEYAAKAGTDQKYSGANHVDDVGWFYANSNGTSQPVGLKRPNAWGLFDMSGNVYEWCWDYFSSDIYNREGIIRDPIGPSTGERRVVRGGGWCNRAGLLRCNYRFYWSPNSKNDYLGFRICRLDPIHQ